MTVASPQSRPHQSTVVIIVNFNAGDLLRRCIESLNTQSLKPKECIIVDNQSETHPLSGQEIWLKNVKIHHAARNLGFAAANNLGADLASESVWLAFLNPDAYAEPDWLSSLHEAALANPEVACFASRQISAQQPSLLDGAGDSLTWGGRPFRRGFGKNLSNSPRDYQEVFSACGAAMLIRRDVFDQAGGFDEDFFCYLEDVDLGFRLRLQDHRCLYVPKATIHHESSALTGRKSRFSSYYGHRNMIWLYLKNMPQPLLWVFLPLHLFETCLGFMRCSLRGQGGLFIRAKWDALKGLRRTLKKRKLIQSSRTVSAWSILIALSHEFSNH